MKPIRLAWTKLVYRGPKDGIGDLWCNRVEPGLIESVWRPEEWEKKALAEGGAIVLGLHSEPIPPISIRVITADESKEVAEHTWKIPAELEERQ